MRPSLVLLGACIFAVPAVVYAQSAQDKADAEVLFNAGKSALATGNLADACPKFAESQKKDPAIGTALYLAECYERSGKIASAWAQFHVAEDMANQRHDNRAGLAKARADRLAPSKLTIALAPGAGDVAGLEVKRDGEAIGNALFGLASPIDGGRHVIVASAPNRKSFEWSGDVPAQSGNITVTVPKLEENRGTTPVASATVTAPVPTTTATATPTVTATATATPPPDTGGGMSGMKVAGIVVGAVGLAGIGASIVMGVVAHNDYQSVLTTNGGSCVDGSASPIHCGTQGDANVANDAVTLANAGNIVFISGAVLAVGGIVMFFVAPKSKPQTALALTPLLSGQGGGAMLSGRF